ncbi:MAG: IPT/TIG domain-containing protein [Flavobacterium sp.]
MKRQLYKKVIGAMCMALAIFIFSCDADVEVDKTFEEILAAQPTITSFSPGTAAIGSNVTVDGTYLNFVNKAYIGNIEAQIFSRENQRTMIITVPPTAVNGKIRLETASGKVAESTEELVITYPVPVITSTFPTQTLVNETITIEGQELQSINKISFGGVDGVIELQDANTIIVRTPNNGPSPLALTYTYMGSTGEVTVVVNPAYTIYIPVPVVTAFPGAILKNIAVIITGENMNLVTSVKLGTQDINGFTATPTTLTFAPPATLASGAYVVTLGYGQSQQLVSNAVPYINRDIQTYFDFEAQDTNIIQSTAAVESHLVAKNLNGGGLSQPPFPGGSNYAHMEMLSPTNNGSSIAYIRFLNSANTSWKTIFDAGAFNNNPVLHFWLNTKNTTPTLRLYMTSAASKKLVHYTTNGEWKLIAIRLRDAFPTVTAADFVSGNYMRMNYLSDNQMNVPLEVNTDWYMVTDGVLTEAGAVDVTNLLN